MSGCTDDRFQQMLYAYELGMLPEEDEQQLELHLYECTHCFESVRQFKDASQLLRHSPQVRKQVQSDAGSASAFKITRILLIAAVMIVVAIPVYKMGFYTEPPHSVQQLLLVPDRSNDSSALSLEKGGIAEIRFVVEEAMQGDEYRISVVSQNGVTVFLNESYSDFKSNGLGVISLSIDELRAGRYTLDVHASSNNEMILITQYLFDVK